MHAHIHINITAAPEIMLHEDEGVEENNEMLQVYDELRIIRCTIKAKFR
jgi:hypothetical protein